MSLEQTRFTLMALPQKVDINGVLSLNIVFIPRNINPLTEMNTDYGKSNKAMPFVKAKPQFEIRVSNNPNEFPGKDPSKDDKLLDPISPIVYSSVMEDIYTALRDTKDRHHNPKYFRIDETRSTDNAGVLPKHRAPDATSNRDTSIRKYLPLTYRNAFNFTAPRIKNAVTDDSYHCSFRDQKPHPAFVKDDHVSWGKVYGYLMRQHLMAKQAGLIYETKVQLEPGDFEKGGWLYVDIKKGTDYSNEQEKSLATTVPPTDTSPFIKRYGARIPILNKNEERSLFAAILFPVMKEGESPVGAYDELFIEAAQFNEGFATIVHANQPVSGNMLQEEQDGFHPQKEAGIRLGWEDEQILIWYLRQMAVEDGGVDRLDAPLGVMGYQIDVKKAAASDWESLTTVESNGNMQLEKIDIGIYKGELPYQVYPTKVYDGNPANIDNYWLPMYFANWNNASLVLPDKTAAKIYQSANEKKFPVKISNTYKAIESKTKLEYGKDYQFRVRLSDISGGCPDPATLSPGIIMKSGIAETTFKRYIAPNTIVIQNESYLKFDNKDPYFKEPSLLLSRPLLGYPAVVYTGRYTNPVDKLINSIDHLLKIQKESGDKLGGRAFGIPDPDVELVEITVEVETLNMDNLASDDGREHYITLYKTYRHFVAFDEAAPDGAIEIPITFKDANVLNLTQLNKPFKDPADNEFIDWTVGKIILPTARNIRLILRAVGEKKTEYWGFDNNTDPKLNSYNGKTTVLSLRQESEVEADIYTDAETAKTLQGIYLQPDPITVKLDPIAFKTLQGGNEGMPDIVHRLGSQLGVAVKDGLSLVSDNGERLQFWCSNMLRHSLSPDNSSITFANKKELHDHWLVCTTLTINRDWTWDSLDASSFDILRSKNGEAFVTIGDLELKRTASYQAIQKNKDNTIRRDYTRIIFIDVVDSKPADKDFPTTIGLEYQVEAKFRKGHNPKADKTFKSRPVLLPTTINPTQTPKLIAAGVALSPYHRNKEYSATEVRTRFLWLEFDKEPLDKNDGLFCRVLAYSPDQLISNNHPSLMEIPQESPLSLDPEYIRVVTPDSSQDDNGLEAMQMMEKSNDEKRFFYLLPMPPGLHHESAELFGMFTYEFRYGHTDAIWSTAQGRFGRALRVSGLQHPAPSISCMLNRNEKIISVNSPFATAVYQGKNVTASPPNTSIWALLYAQVKQADDQDYRNILLSELQLKPLKRKNAEELYNSFNISLEKQNEEYKRKELPTITITKELLKQNVYQQMAWDKESPRNAFGRWTNQEVDELLRLYGLPINSPLSVLCVEVFGQITNAYKHIENFEANKDAFVEKTSLVFNEEVAYALKKNLKKAKSPKAPAPIDPLNSQLGLFRILRTSPLTKVPFICTTE